MNDASKHAGAKPRLSLFSSKQAVIRLKSDEQLDPNQQQSSSDIVVPDISESKQQQSDRNEPAQYHNQQSSEAFQSNSESDDNKETRLNASTQNDLNKMDISKEDLIRLLFRVKSELQSKEIALAAIKCEQLKRLINPIEISRSSLASTYMKLQDRFKQKDQNNNSSSSTTKQKKPAQSLESSSASGQQQQSKNSIGRDQDGTNSSGDIDEENLNILIALLELLDQHPLLALPRDSIFCLDYNCNELSTKNYLNLKIQHLDNLIDQHRQFRYYMINRLKRSEQRLSEITSQLEFERSLKLENGKTIYGATGETVLVKRICEVLEALEKEKKDKQVIVMTLLNELLDEKERASSLVAELAKSKSLQSNEISGEKDKLLKMQSELDVLSLQMKNQASTFAAEKQKMSTKLTSLKSENESLKYKLEQLEKQRPILSPKPLQQQETKETTSPRIASPSSSPARTNTSSTKSTNSSTSSYSRQAHTNLNSPTATMRATKPSPPSRISNSPNSTSPATATAAQNLAGQHQHAASPPVRLSSTHSTSVNNRTKQPTPTGSGADQSTGRAQPLFKSASVLSSHQQVRTVSVSGGQRTNSSNNSSHLVRSTSTTQASTAKPQVPAKPAQLLDQQQRGSS